MIKKVQLTAVFVLLLCLASVAQITGGGGGGGGGTGTVTHSVGPLTLDEPLFGNGSADIVAEPSSIIISPQTPGSDICQQITNQGTAFGLVATYDARDISTGLTCTPAHTNAMMTTVPFGSTVLLPAATIIVGSLSRTTAGGTTNTNCALGQSSPTASECTTAIVLPRIRFVGAGTDATVIRADTTGCSGAPKTGCSNFPIRSATVTGFTVSNTIFVQLTLSGLVGPVPVVGELVDVQTTNAGTADANWGTYRVCGTGYPALCPANPSSTTVSFVNENNVANGTPGGKVFFHTFLVALGEDQVAAAGQATNFTNNTQMENLSLDCQGIAGCGGWTNTSAQENSWVRAVATRNMDAIGFAEENGGASGFSNSGPDWDAYAVTTGLSNPPCHYGTLQGYVGDNSTRGFYGVGTLTNTACVTSTNFYGYNPGPTTTSWSITSNVVTFNGTNFLTPSTANQYEPLNSGTNFTPAGLVTGTFMNGQILTVCTTPVSGCSTPTNTVITAQFTHANGSATENGTLGTNTPAVGMKIEGSKGNTFFSGIHHESVITGDKIGEGLPSVGVNIATFKGHATLTNCILVSNNFATTSDYTFTSISNPCKNTIVDQIQALTDTDSNVGLWTFDLNGSNHGFVTTGSFAIRQDSGFTTTGTSTAGEFDASGTNGGFLGLEGTCANAAAAATFDVLCPNSTAHWFEISGNNSTLEPVAGINGVVTAGHFATFKNGNEIQDGGTGTAALLNTVGAAAGNASIANGNFNETWTSALTGSTDAFDLNEATAGTSTGASLGINLLANSTNPGFYVKGAQPATVAGAGTTPTAIGGGASAGYAFTAPPGGNSTGATGGTGGNVNLCSSGNGGSSNAGSANAPGGFCLINVGLPGIGGNLQVDIHGLQISGSPAAGTNLGLQHNGALYNPWLNITNPTAADVSHANWSGSLILDAQEWLDAGTSKQEGLSIQFTPCTVTGGPGFTGGAAGLNVAPCAIFQFFQNNITTHPTSNHYIFGTFDVRGDNSGNNQIASDGGSLLLGGPDQDGPIGFQASSATNTVQPYDFYFMQRGSSSNVFGGLNTNAINGANSTTLNLGLGCPQGCGTDQAGGAGFIAPGLSSGAGAPSTLHIGAYVAHGSDAVAQTYHDAITIAGAAAPIVTIPNGITMGPGSTLDSSTNAAIISNAMGGDAQVSTTDTLTGSVLGANTQGFFLTHVTTLGATAANTIDGTHRGVLIKTQFDYTATATVPTFQTALFACPSANFSSSTTAPCSSGQVALYTATATAPTATTSTQAYMEFRIVASSTNGTLNVTRTVGTVNALGNAAATTPTAVSCGATCTGTAYVLYEGIKFGSNAASNLMTLISLEAPYIH